MQAFNTDSCTGCQREGLQPTPGELICISTTQGLHKPGAYIPQLRHLI